MDDDDASQRRPMATMAYKEIFGPAVWASRLII